MNCEKRCEALEAALKEFACKTSWQEVTHWHEGRLLGWLGPEDMPWEFAQKALDLAERRGWTVEEVREDG